VAREETRAGTGDVTVDPEDRATRAVHLAGDSTAAPKLLDAAPETGWGMGLGYYLRRHGVVNHARNGRSSASFLALGGLERVAGSLCPGDVLVVQFGHNDAKVEDPERFTDPWTTYQAALLTLVETARGCGAQPVLVTPIERRAFDADGRAVAGHGEYPDAMRALARQEDVPLVDAQAESLDLWQRLGPDESRRYFLHSGGRRDDTHLSPTGAGAVARLVAAGLVSAGVLDQEDVVHLDTPVPAGWFRWAEGELPG
jgi:lysophospholipase L1-like esterase